MSESKLAKALWDNQLDESMDEIIRTDERLSSGQRLLIYQNSIRSILIHTLQKTFSVCHQLVGYEFFNALAYRFIIDRPSLSFDLDHYGEDFPDYIADFTPANSVPYLSDIARLEWYWQGALLAPASEAIDAQAFNEIQASANFHEVIFQLPHYIRFLASQYPISKIWEMHHDPAQEGVNLDEGAVQLVIFRVKNPQIIVVTPAQWLLLTTLRQDVTFAGLLIEFERHFSADVFVENFVSLVKLGLITQHLR